MLRLDRKKGFVAMAGVALTLALVGAGIFGAVVVVSASKVTVADLEMMTRHRLVVGQNPGLVARPGLRSRCIDVVRARL